MKCSIQRGYRDRSSLLTVGASPGKITQFTRMKDIFAVTACGAYPHEVSDIAGLPSHFKMNTVFSFLNNNKNLWHDSFFRADYLR